MSEKLKVLDLFSGIGGFTIGFDRAGLETVAFCEIETIAFYSNDAGCFDVTTCTVTLDAAAISSNYIT